MTYGEMLVRNATEWVASNRVGLENFAWMITWLVAWIVAAVLVDIIIGPRRMARMLSKLDRACERWMGR
jgi:hypothetical protein